MNYLLDTNHWSYLQRGHPSILSRLHAIAEDSEVYMSVVNQAELMVGVELTAEGKRKDELRRLYREAIGQATHILDITPNIAETFVQVFVKLRSKGRPIETNDIWIAATALCHDLTLVTNDDHFTNIDDLQLENWTI